MKSIMQQDKAPSNKRYDAQNQSDNLETLARVAKELGAGPEGDNTARLIRRMLNKQVKDLAAHRSVSLGKKRLGCPSPLTCNLCTTNSDQKSHYKETKQRQNPVENHQ